MPLLQIPLSGLRTQNLYLEAIIAQEQQVVSVLPFPDPK